MKIVLYLMNEKGKKVLEKVCEHFNNTLISAVVSSRDANVQNDFYEEIKNICVINNILFLDRKDDKSQYINEYRIVVGWRWIINSEEKLIVLHDSLLPKYRGFSPLVNALINGEKKVGVTALFASKEFDKGDIISQKEMIVTYPIKIKDAISLIAELYQELVIEVIEALLNNSLQGVIQNEEEASYSIWRDEEDYHIDWNNTAEDIVRFINVVGYPYSGAYAFIDKVKVRILEAEVYTEQYLELIHVGKVLQVKDNSPIVIASKGLVKINKMTDESNKDVLPLEKFRVRFN